LKKFEFVVCLILVLTLIGKLLGLPLSGLLLELTSFILAGFYYFLSFALFNGISFKGIFKESSYKNISAFRIISAIIAGWAFSVLFIGIFFKLEVLPYAKNLMIVGLAVSGSIFIISLISFLRSKSDYFRQILFRIVIIGGIGLFLFFTK
jgi:hypothetical protein